MGKAKTLLTLGATLALGAGCARVDGMAPSGAPGGDAGLVAGQRCEADLDCGTGRYCSADRICTLDCLSSKDCAFSLAGPEAANNLECSPCGRCVEKGREDALCVVVSDTECDNDDVCVKAYGDAYVCGPSGVCVRTCGGDDDCKRMGRGWSCGTAGVCERRCTRDLDCVFHGWQFVCDLPEGTAHEENAYSGNPLVSECVKRDGGVDWGGGGDPSKPAFAWRGVWGMIFNGAARTLGLPLVNKQDTVSCQHLLVKITPEGDGLRFHEKWCGLEIIQFNEDDSPVNLIAWMVVPDLYVDSIPVRFHHAFGVPSLVPGAAFPTDRMLEIRGAKLENPETDPLPIHGNLANQWDQDRDGNPGLTTTMMGVLTGEVYNAMRWWGSFEIVVVDENHFAGLAEHGTEQTVLGSTSEVLVQDTTVIKHPHADRSFVRAMRMDDNASCEDVLKEKKRPGGWLEYVPHFDPAKKP
ncbi:MAG: hypothetical protein HY897_14985 [Deltaproteobacteria bacterium]|nr:hypothetical protein [Deltaproteobacteria bacterium]